jgi:hypothetical protein
VLEIEGSTLVTATRRYDLDSELAAWLDSSGVLLGELPAELGIGLRAGQSAGVLVVGDGELVILVDEQTGRAFAYDGRARTSLSPPRWSD